MSVAAAFWLSMTLGAYCQIEKFLDYKDRETDITHARFYVNIIKTDSGWLRNDYFIRERKLQMSGLYQDSTCKIASGTFYYFHSNGQLQSTGHYVDGKKDGLWIGYYSNGMINDSTHYNRDRPVGTSLRWHRNGFLSDSSVFNGDGNAVKVSWFDDGSVSAAGRFSAGYKENGKWKYFHKNGKVSAEEIYESGRLVDRKYFDENGNPEADTTSKDRRSDFPGGPKAWLKYLDKKGYFPPQYTITNADSVTVVVRAEIDEDGKVDDVEIVVPFNPSFDDIVKRVLQKSPPWIPAIHHNRKVKSYITQPVTFAMNRK